MEGGSKGGFTTFTVKDGLAHNVVWDIAQDSEGDLWFATEGGGVSRYDEQTLTTFTTDDGLVDNDVRAILQDSAGNLWFATFGGVTRYDGQTTTTFTTEDGLVDNRVYSILEDREGNIWFGTLGGGVSRYDGTRFTNFTEADGLTSGMRWSMLQDRDGNLWFGGTGVTRFDGGTFTTFTTEDGLAGYTVYSMSEDREGNVWFGTESGLSRYNGETFTNFTTAEGLVNNAVRSILQDRDGNLWFGTFSGGVSRYDPPLSSLPPSDSPRRRGRVEEGSKGGFTTFSTADGLGHNDVRAIVQDAQGHLWFATDGGVVSRYDGQVFQTLTRLDGLTGNSMWSMLQDKDGDFWFPTLGAGVTRFRPPPPKSPPVFIDTVVADKRYENVSAVEILSNVGLVVFEFHGTSFKTRPEAMVYRYRLAGYDAEWKNTNERRVEYQNLPKGSYTFEVLAVDRDLVYSEAPATVRLKVVLPWYLRASFLAPTVGGGTTLLAALIVVSIGYFKRRRQVRVYEREAARELRDARRMQMSLLPESPPNIEGVEIAGRCLPANTVSGDFYDYLTLGENTQAIVLADVTGKSLKGAMNAVLSSGALHAEAKLGVSPAQMLWVLNRDLHGRFQDRTNCAMIIATIEPSQKVMQYANAGLPYPILKRGEEISELESNGMPLGGFRNAQYQDVSHELQPGDVLIFFSDGVTESPSQADSEQLYMETDRLASLIKGFDGKMTAQEMVDAVINDAIAYSGESAQRGDDMTVVVVKVR